MAKFEKLELEVVEFTEDDIKLKLDLAPADYSEIYEMSLFKKQYNKETEEWEESDEVTERFNEQLEAISGYEEDGATFELFVNEQGRAFITEPKGFVKPNKPAAKLDGKMWLNTTITEVRDSPKAREVIVMYKDELYSFSFNTGMWIEKKKQYILNKAKHAKAVERFNKIFEDVVSDAWNNVDALKGCYISVKINKNALDPKSEYGWLEPIAPDEASYNREYLDSLEAEKEETEDDLPF